MRRAMIAIVATLAGSALQTAVAAEGQSGGLPQLNANDFAPQLFWLAITFTLLYFVMARVALPRIGEVLEERRDRIQRDLAAAERLKGETEKALDAYEKALADARASASGIARQTRDALAAEVEKERHAIEAQLTAKIHDAEARINATKGKALATVNDIAIDAVTAIVKKLLGEDVRVEDAKQALSSASGK
jgi:F-type H+-transporting ATPase subunit b